MEQKQEFVLSIDDRGYEKRPHGSHDFPITLGPVSISHYKDHRFPAHWHTDPEFTVIIDGEMTYQVDGKEYRLKKGQAIYANSNCLHSAWDETGKCAYIPVNFNPSVLFGYRESRVFKKYVEPIITSPGLPGIVLDSESDENDKRVIDSFYEAVRVMREKPSGYELTVMRYICDMWSVVAPRALKIIEETGGRKTAKQVSRMKKAIDYVEHNYKETIVLDDLASVCGLSRSELCRAFKTIMRQSPMEYVTAVRVRKALPLLASKEYSITEIAELCGFSGSSYFAEMFKRYMGCTPTQYSKKVGTET